MTQSLDTFVKLTNLGHFYTRLPGLTQSETYTLALFAVWFGFVRLITLSALVRNTEMEKLK